MHYKAEAAACRSVMATKHFVKLPHRPYLLIFLKDSHLRLTPAVRIVVRDAPVNAISKTMSLLKRRHGRIHGRLHALLQFGHGLLHKWLLGSLDAVPQLRVAIHSAGIVVDAETEESDGVEGDFLETREPCLLVIAVTLPVLQLLSDILSLGFVSHLVFDASGLAFGWRAWILTRREWGTWWRWRLSATKGEWRWWRWRRETSSRRRIEESARATCGKLFETFGHVFLDLSSQSSQCRIFGYLLLALIAGFLDGGALSETGMGASRDP